MQNIFNNPWIIGIGVTVIGGLILYYIFRIGKGDKSSKISKSPFISAGGNISAGRNIIVGGQKTKTLEGRGGNGGSIFIFTKNLAGSGKISVDGGEGVQGGDAGKVHIETNKNNFKGEISAKGGNAKL